MKTIAIIFTLCATFGLGIFQSQGHINESSKENSVVENVSVAANADKLTTTDTSTTPAEDTSFSAMRIMYPSL